MILYKTARSLICIWDDELRLFRSLTLLESGRLLLETKAGSKRVLIEQADNHDWRQLTRQIEAEIERMKTADVPSKNSVWRNPNTGFVAAIAAGLILVGAVWLSWQHSLPEELAQNEQLLEQKQIDGPKNRREHRQKQVDKPEKMARPVRYEQIGEGEVFNPLETDQPNAGADLLFGGADRNCVFDSRK